MATAGNWRTEDICIEEGEGKSPFSVIMSLIWWLSSTILAFAFPFMLYFLPLAFLSSYERAEPYMSRITYTSYRDAAQAFYLSTQDTVGIVFIGSGLFLALLCAVTSLYGKTSWRLFLLVTGFALCCLTLRYMEIDFEKESIEVGPSFNLNLDRFSQMLHLEFISEFTSER